MFHFRPLFLFLYYQKNYGYGKKPIDLEEIALFHKTVMESSHSITINTEGSNQENLFAPPTLKKLL